MTVPRKATQQPRIALLHWGDLIEDFLDPIGVPFEGFRDAMTGGWMFGYVDALAQAGVETVLVCVTAKVDRPTRHHHQDTGATLWQIPASRTYLRLRRLASRPDRVRLRLRQRVARQLAPYLSTPLLGLGRLLRRERCQALLCQEYEHPRFDACVLLGSAFRIPVFATFQGGSTQAYRLEHWTRPPALRFCHGLVIATKREATRVHARYGVPLEKIARIPNPFDPVPWQAGNRLRARRELGFGPTTLVVAWHGRADVRVKGLDTLLDAWRQLRSVPGGDDLRLLLVGTGEDAGQLRKLLADWPDHHVQFVDEYVLDQPRRRDYLTAADVYCLPSRREGSPVAPLEAMACSLPVVAARGDATEELFPEGKSSGAILVPPGDAVALSEALRQLLNDETLRRSMAERARERFATAFAPDAIGIQLRHFVLDGPT